MHALINGWLSLVDAFGTHAVAPLLAALHLTPLSAPADEIAGALMIALLQVCIIGFVFRPLERVFPAERWTDYRLARIDRTYTLLMLISLFPLFSYLMLTPLVNWLSGSGGMAASAEKVTGLAAWFPWFRLHPLAQFAVFYLAYDLIYYLMHRLQHLLPWWWAMHSMHHSQRQLGCWANDRTHYLDGILQSFVLASVGIVLGVSPENFAWLMLAGELMQNLSHANLRWNFGPFGRVFVSPVFHRLHHMKMDPARPKLHNCNFGQVFAFWDLLFGSALYDEPVRPTGVTDPVIDADNDLGIVAQQIYVLRRFWAAFTCVAGWRLGDVAFDANLRPYPSAHEPDRNDRRPKPLSPPAAG